jgi:hypothetical protein
MANFNKIDRAAAFDPIGAFPLDARVYFESFDAAKKAAQSAEEAGSTNSRYFIGQLLVVVEDETVEYYVILPDKTLSRIGQPQFIVNQDDSSLGILAF